MFSSLVTMDYPFCRTIFKFIGLVSLNIYLSAFIRAANLVEFPGTGIGTFHSVLAMSIISYHWEIMAWITLINWDISPCLHFSIPLKFFIGGCMRGSISHTWIVPEEGHSQWYGPLGWWFNIRDQQCVDVQFQWCWADGGGLLDYTKVC